MEENKIIIGYDNFNAVIKKYKIKNFDIKKIKRIIIDKGIPVYPNHPKYDIPAEDRSIMYQGTRGWKKFLENLSSLDDMIEEITGKKEKIPDKKKTNNDETSYITCDLCESKFDKEEFEENSGKFCTYCGHELGL